MKEDKTKVPNYKRRGWDWKWLIGVVLLPFLALLWPDFRALFRSPSPRFVLADNCIHPQDSIVILPANNAAVRQLPLDVKFDGFDFRIDFHSQNDSIRWPLLLPMEEPPRHLLDDGAHFMRFGFARRFTDSTRIYFDSTVPETKVQISGDDTGAKSFYGVVKDKGKPGDNEIDVEFKFRHHERLQTIQVPVKRITQADGQTHFEFEYQVQNLPRYERDDPNYKAPYFALVVRDEAGNEFRQAETYNAFIAEGERVFGFKAAEVVVEKIEGDRASLDVPGATQPGSAELPPDYDIAGGPPLIKLRVLIRTPHYVRLSWNRLPADLRPPSEQYTILRNDRAIGTSFDATYTDRDADEAAEYQVLAHGSDGRIYSSNKTAGQDAPPKSQIEFSFRTTPTTLSAQDVQQMLDRYDFYSSDGRPWKNPDGNGVENEFNILQGGQLVYDAATGLTWQQSGSAERLTFEEAQEYVQALNQKKFAGYSDWRLPTLEEGMSLMEPRQNEAGGLFIDPIFDEKQRWIWTSDMESASRAWVVNFSDGGCNIVDVGGNDGYDVRAVR